MLGASKESAKELKLFGLSGFLSGEYARLSNDLYDQNVRLARRRLLAGALLSLLSTAAYYGAYAYVIYQTVIGALTWGSLQFLAGAHRRRQRQYSKHLLHVLQHRRSVPLPHRPGGVPACPADASLPSPMRLPRRGPFATASCSSVSVSPIPDSNRLVLDRLNLRIAARRAHRPDRRERPGQDHHRQTAHAALRPHRRPHSAGRRGPARIQHRGPAQPDRRHLPGLHALRDERAREHCGRPHRRRARSAIRAGGAEESGRRRHQSCRAATSSCWGAALKAAWTSRVASGRKSRWRALTFAMLNF